jgi:hypothetical protein
MDGWMDGDGDGEGEEEEATTDSSETKWATYIFS